MWEKLNNIFLYLGDGQSTFWLRNRNLSSQRGEEEEAAHLPLLPPVRIHLLPPVREGGEATVLCVRVCVSVSLGHPHTARQ